MRTLERVLVFVMNCSMWFPNLKRGWVIGAFLSVVVVVVGQRRFGTGGRKGWCFLV